MSDQSYMQADEGNPMVEGLGQAGRGAAEAAALLAMGMQLVARMREKRANAQVAGDDIETQRRQDELRTELARARTQWAPAFEPDFTTAATDRGALGVWVAAQPWREHDRSAEDASLRAEARLEQLHPDLMTQYRLLREPVDGLEPIDTVEAMRFSVQALDAPTWATPLHGDTWQEMDVADTLRAWNAARPWASEEGGDIPQEAMRCAEARLRVLRPVGMQTYDERLALGDSPLQAMRASLPEMRAWEAQPVAKGSLGSPVEPMTRAETEAYMADRPGFAARVEQRGRELAEERGLIPQGPTGTTSADPDSPSFPQPFGREPDVGAAEAAQTVGDEQRAGAARSFTARDDPTTPQDEGTQGATAGADHLEYADASTARAASVANQSFPQPVQMTSSRSAAAPTRAAAAPAAARPRRR